MEKPLKIRFVSDYVCPYCLVAKIPLLEAIKGRNVEVEWVPYELTEEPAQRIDTYHDPVRKEKWGKTDAYRESTEKTKGYTKEKWDEVNLGMDSILAEFAQCKKNGSAPDSEEAQALVKKWQDFLTENYYNCTKEILSGLGEMYAADERFKANIDRHGSCTAEFMQAAIKAYCG